MYLYSEKVCLQFHRYPFLESGVNQSCLQLKKTLFVNHFFSKMLVASAGLYFSIYITVYSPYNHLHILDTSLEVLNTWEQLHVMNYTYNMFIADIISPQAGFEPPLASDQSYLRTPSQTKPPRLVSCLSIIVLFLYVEELTNYMAGTLILWNICIGFSKFFLLASLETFPKKSC